MDKNVLQLALQQVEALKQVDTLLREHVRTHIDAYDDEDEMIYILATLSELATKQLKLAAMIARAQ